MSCVLCITRLKKMPLRKTEFQKSNMPALAFTGEQQHQSTSFNNMQKDEDSEWLTVPTCCRICGLGESMKEPTHTNTFLQVNIHC